jgi:predicted AlkP superfamily pyrophosphatase or phosphodiesterase
LLATVAPAQTPLPRPKLVVVIVIDQFRPDYLKRFHSYFDQGGFNRFLREGAVFANSKYEHAITLTCPGHAVVLTGSYADVNGIVSNQWYDQKTGRAEYCAADSSAALLGVSGEGRSPKNLIDSTVGDVLKSSSAGRSRVITISGKDRAAIMLGGHLADAAYWTEDTLFVSSSYYMKELPIWVQRFNASGAVTRYRGETWDRLLPSAAYAMLGPDDVAAEEPIAGMGRTFPHRLSVGRSSIKPFTAAFQTSPFENEVITDFAMQAVIQEGLGRNAEPDLLGIGFSANDLVGHAYGPDSHEVMDLTARTDRLLVRFFSFLDQAVGRENVLIVLTSDHGVAPLPELVLQRDPSAGAGRIDPSIVAAAAERTLRARFGVPRGPGRMVHPSWIVHEAWPWLYLNLAALRDKRVPVEEAERVAKQAIEKVPGIRQALTASELRRQRNGAIQSSVERSFYPDRSGNIYCVLRPYVLPVRQVVGTTHGSPWPYDTRVPILWFGAGIRPGVYPNEAAVTDIAPTLSVLLGVPQPSGAQGRVLREMLR